MMNSLEHYHAACAALHTAVTADEVMKIHKTAQMFQAVAKMAKNLGLEIDALTLRTRAAVKLGDMLREAESKGELRVGKASKDPTHSPAAPRIKLKEIGVTKQLSSQSQKLSGLGLIAIETMLARMRQESSETGKLAIHVITNELATRTAQSRRNLAHALSERTAALSPTGRKFPVIYADPAWHRKAGIGDRAYENHYDTMTWNEILVMPVMSRVLPDAWLFLWIPRAHLLALHPTVIDSERGPVTIKMPLAWAVAQAWGFSAYSTCFIWTKTDEEAPHDHGLGLLAWDQDEILCLFKRGQGLPKPMTTNKFGSNHRERAGDHSAKPAFYRDMINAMTAGADGVPLPVLELFAREDEKHVLPENFFTWGNQSKNTAERAA